VVGGIDPPSESASVPEQERPTESVLPIQEEPAPGSDAEPSIPSPPAGTEASIAPKRRLGLRSTAYLLAFVAVVIIVGGLAYSFHMRPAARLQRNVEDPVSWRHMKQRWERGGDSERASAAGALEDMLQGLRPDPADLKQVPPVLAEVGVSDDEGIGDLADRILAYDYRVALEVYGLAARLDSTDSEWSDSISNIGERVTDSLSFRLLIEPGDTTDWNDLRQTLRVLGQHALAESADAVFALLAPPSRVADESVETYELAPTILRWMALDDDEWIGDLGDTAEDRGLEEAAMALYRLALELDPDDWEWLGKVGWRAPPP
jgi:hypothetical protein